MVTRVDHIELVVQHFEEHVALFRALGFKELTRTKHHGDSVEFQLPGENQPIFEIHRVSGEENIGVNHIAFQVPDVPAAVDAVVAAGGSRFGEVVAMQTRDGRTITWVYTKGPDGNLVELQAWS